MKSLLDSKTVWFNVIMLILFITSLVDATLLDMFGISPLMSIKIMSGVGLVTTIGNYILRVFFTSTALTQTAIDNK